MRLMPLIPLLFSAVLSTACNEKNCLSGPVPSNCIFDSATCSCTWSDGGFPNTPDAPADGGDVKMIGPLCGNGVLDPGEQCDDGNRLSGDGCNAFCQSEARWDCLTPGEPCIPCGTDGAGGCDGGPMGYCGDGIIQPYLGEECDFGPLNGECLDEQVGTLPDAGQGPGDAGCPLGSWDLNGTQICICPAGTLVICSTTCQMPYCCGY